MCKMAERHADIYGTQERYLSSRDVEWLQGKHDEIEAIAININNLGKMDEDLAVKVETELEILRQAIQNKGENDE